MEPLLALLGGAASLLLFRFLGARQYYGGELLLGALLFLGTLIVQPLIQIAPFLYYGTTPAEVSERGAPMAIVTSLYLGFVAGAIQSLLKYYFAKDMTRSKALSLGLGFGLAEAAYIALAAYIAAIVSSLPTAGNVAELSLGLLGLPLVFLERFAATTFHGASAAMLADFASRGRGLAGLALLAAIHGAIDSLAASLALGVLSGLAVVLLLELAVLVISISLALLYARGLASERPEAPLY